MRYFNLSLAIALLFSADASSAAGSSASAEVRDLNGRVIGTVELDQTPNGVLIQGSFTGLDPGKHAFHIHTAGVCEPPFASAGGHFAPDGTRHGFKDKLGSHAGDLPNVTAPTSGNAEFEILTSGVSLDDGPRSLFDADGASLVLHSEADDHTSDPAGDSGKRIACGVIERSASGTASLSDGAATAAAKSSDPAATASASTAKATASGTSGEQPAPGAVVVPSKKFDGVDTVRIVSVDAASGALTVDSAPVGGGESQQIVYHTHSSTRILSGAKAITLGDLAPGDRVVIEASTEPDVAAGASAPTQRKRIARNIQVVIDPTPKTR